MLRRPHAVLIFLILLIAITLIFYPPQSSYTTYIRNTILVWKSKSPSSDHDPATSNLAGNHSSGVDDAEDPSRFTPEDRPTLHLLIPDFEPNSAVCRTLLTAAILNYPPPTLLTPVKGKNDKSDLNRIRRVSNYLNKKGNVEDNDLVLVVDGKDTWFQLPPEIMIHRYQMLLRKANYDLRSKYGADQVPGQEMVTPFENQVVFGATKTCTLYTFWDPMCKLIPDSPLTRYTYPHSSSEEISAEPKYLDIGVMLGRASELRSVYNAAIRQIEQPLAEDLSSQTLMAKLFAEQEFDRDFQLKSTPGIASQLRKGLFSKFGTSKPDQPVPSNTIQKPTEEHEYGIGLDYESSIFQTLAMSVDDVSFVKFNGSEPFSGYSNKSGLELPTDIGFANPPWIPYAATAGKKNLPNTFRFKEALDVLPKNITWHDLFLASNMRVETVPAVLVVHDGIGDADAMGPWWQQMWYQPYARALLRNRMRGSTGPIAAHVATTDDDSWWNVRGGIGGVWTDKNVWKDWGEFCRGYEDQIFGDRKGRFGKEDGDPPVYNSFGLLISGQEPAKKD